MVERNNYIPMLKLVNICFVPNVGKFSGCFDTYHLSSLGMLWKFWPYYLWTMQIVFNFCLYSTCCHLYLVHIHFISKYYYSHSPILKHNWAASNPSMLLQVCLHHWVCQITWNSISKFQGLLFLFLHKLRMWVNLCWMLQLLSVLRYKLLSLKVFIFVYLKIAVAAGIGQVSRKRKVNVCSLFWSGH